MTLNPQWTETLLLLALVASCGAACRRQETATATPTPAAVPVMVAPVVQKTMPVELRAIGAVEAFSTVAVKAQVGGEVEEVHFREGDDVEKGQLLFTIDSRPFAIALQQAEANLTRDLARTENARAQARRYARLFEEGVASREQYDQARTDAEALEAIVAADRAAVEKARLDLRYCRIPAPLEGRTGSLLVHAGNLVKANENPPLVVINQISPIRVGFSIPEQHLSEVKKRQAAAKMAVRGFLPDDPARPERGELTFLDNAVDQATGTIRLKATFSNSAQRLWPGQFVNLALELTSQSNAVVVPAQAVQNGQSGPYVYVARTDGTAALRPVTPGRTVNGETVIEKGLAAGETVVTDGHLRLVPGARIEIKSGVQID